MKIALPLSLVRYAVLFDEFRLSSPARCGRFYCKIELWVSVGDQVHCYSMKHSPYVEKLVNEPMRPEFLY